jgi:glycosyltransferase involved in cell wall biosynthesis
VIDEFSPDVLHVHDIWLAESTFRARRHEPVILDLHENMPAAVVEYLKGFRGAKRIFNWVFKRRGRVLAHERRALAASALTLVVVDEAASRVRQEHPGVPPESVVVVENLESKDFLEVTQSVAAPPLDERPSLLYIGGFGPHRGIDTLAESMKHLKDWGVDVRLDLVGARPGQYVNMLREKITRLGVWSHVNMVEWVRPEAVLPMIKHATIGAVPHHANPHTDNTIPHKLFQYMIAGTPVLVSTSAPLARTVTAAQSGGVFRAGDALSCANAIRDMLTDRAALARMGENGRHYTLLQGHNWEEESAPRLVEAYDRLPSRR